MVIEVSAIILIYVFQCQNRDIVTLSPEMSPDVSTRRTTDTLAPACLII